MNSIMRYSLRNQNKISAAFDEKFLKRVLDSLTESFKENRPPPELHKDDPFPIIYIDDEGHSCGFIVFHVIRKTFDTYNLAFKEIIN